MSAAIETPTQELSEKAWEYILEIEELGGMAKAIESGIPKMRIEEASAKKQARIDSGQDIIVGEIVDKLYKHFCILYDNEHRNTDQAIVLHDDHLPSPPVIILPSPPLILYPTAAGGNGGNDSKGPRSGASSKYDPI